MASVPGDTIMLSAARPLVEAGFAVHLLRPRSKAPAARDWSTAPVASFADLRSAYRQGANLGVRLGEPSSTGAGFLHVFDIDIRVADLADEAWAAFRALFPDIDPDALPSVASGSGGESRHLYFVSEKPFASKLLAVSEGKHRREKVDPATGEVKSGWSYDWEIELFGTGKQVVLPPSIHPDTDKPYVWEREFDLVMLDCGIGPEIPAAQIEALGVTQHTTYAFESREPLEFKAGQLERELEELAISDFVYDDWIRLGQALHHQFGAAEAGWDLWLQHTRRSTKHNGDERTMRKKWRSFGRYRGQPVTMATVRHWVQEARIAELTDAFEDLGDESEGVGSTDTLEIEALLGDGPSSTDLVALLDDLPAQTVAPGAVGVTLPAPIDPEWRSKMQLTEDGEIKCTLHNVALIVKNDIRIHGVVAFNQLSQETVLRGKTGQLKQRKEGPKGTIQLDDSIWTPEDPINGDIWTDQHDFALRAMIEAPKRQGGYGLKVTDRDLKGGVELAGIKNAFHPIREYLIGLRWDGIPRIDSLFVDYLGAEDNAYHREIARKTFVGAVARVFEPGHKFDFVPILEGLQGKRKSTFIETIGKHWHSELEGDFHDRKMMIEKMQGAWIMELPELQGFVRAEITTLKGFVSARQDKGRLAFDKRAKVFKRQCIFFGSTNNPEYLRDETGNRRFWPVYCAIDEIDIERLATEIDQVWAEANEMYRRMRTIQPFGFLPLYIQSEDAKQIALGLQESRRIETAEDGLAGTIAAWLNTPIGAELEDLDDAGVIYRNKTCLIEIWVDMLGKDRAAYDQRQAQQLGRAIKMVPGWMAVGAQVTERFGLQRVYVRKEKR